MIVWGSASVEAGTEQVNLHTSEPEAESVKMECLDSDERERAQAFEEWLDKGQKTLMDARKGGQSHEKFRPNMLSGS